MVVPLSMIDIQAFLNKFATWAARQNDIQAIALVGSYARKTAKTESDVDLVIITTEPDKYLNDSSWDQRIWRN
jgi:predicted nucleotidyltransferase